MHDSLIGTVVDGRYAITALIGRGGMATVYRARDKRLERDIAIKLMHPHLAEKSDLNTRFNKEARAAAQLSNPYVVAIHDQGVWASPDGARAYLVMEYVPGPDLRTELQRLGSLSLGACLDVTEQILRALTAAHDAGIVHRDVKPENILLTQALPDPSAGTSDIHAKVADFGLAHVVDAESSANSTILGTVAYIPPESIDSGIFEPASDFYALGIMMYEILSGHLPFRGKTPMQTAYMHIYDAMPRLTDTADWIPESVDSFIGHLTAKDSKKRPQDAHSALTELLALKEGIDEETLARRIPVLPTRPHSENIKEDSAQDYQEKTAIYPHTSAPLSVRADTSAPSSSVLDKAAHSELSTRITTTPTEALPINTHSAEDSPASTSDSKPRSKKSRKRSKDSAKTATESRKKRRRAIVILLIALLLALAGTGAWYFLAGPGKRVAIPDVAGQTAEVGEKKLTDVGFVVERKEAYSDDVEAGLVISTDPSNTRLRIGSTVTMTVSLGIEQVEVPQVVSLPRDEALAKLEGARLQPKITESYSDDVAKDLVISQSLEAGKQVNHDSTIDVVISLGREPVDVPSLADMTRDKAVKTLEDAGLKADVKEDFSETIPAGKVISQNPENGTVYRGDAVTVVISKGPPVVQVPNVTDLSAKDAKTKLEAAGLKVDEHAPLGSTRYSRVWAQYPGSGQTVPIGSTVRITVV